MTTTYGHIVAFNSLKGGFIAAAERFFTRSKYNHVSVVIPPILGIPAHVSATWKVVTEPTSHFLNDPSEMYQMYLPVGFTTDQLLTVLSRVYNEFSGETYGFLQLLWFVYRWLMESWPFHKDVRRGHNWFPGGPICSEVSWYYMMYLCDQQPKRTELLRAKLNEWRPDTFSPADCVDVMKAFPEIFVLTEQRWK
jgi:hypothetical protein